MPIRASGPAVKVIKLTTLFCGISGVDTSAKRRGPGADPAGGIWGAGKNKDLKDSGWRETLAEEHFF
jgi:hypothetical protein